MEIFRNIVAVLCVLFLFCDTKDPVMPTFISDNPCVLPVTVIDGVGTTAITIGMNKSDIEKRMTLYLVDTLSGRFYYHYSDSCNDLYTIEYTDTNTVRAIEIESQRIRCAATITVGTTKNDIEAVYGPATVTNVYQKLNALHYDIEGLIFFVDDSTGLQSVKILAPLKLLPVKSGYGSEEINVNSTKSSISSLKYDRLSFNPSGSYDVATLINGTMVYGIWFENDTTVSSILFGSKVICDSIITKRSTIDDVIKQYSTPDTLIRFETLKEDMYCYNHKGVNFIFDSTGYVIQTEIYPPQ